MVVYILFSTLNIQAFGQVTARRIAYTYAKLRNGPVRHYRTGDYPARISKIQTKIRIPERILFGTLIIIKIITVDEDHIWKMTVLDISCRRYDWLTARSVLYHCPYVKNSFLRGSSTATHVTFSQNKTNRFQAYCEVPLLQGYLLHSFWRSLVQKLLQESISPESDICTATQTFLRHFRCICELIWDALGIPLTFVINTP